MLLQLIYFIVFGWWFGALVAVVGYLLCVSVIGLPIGVMLLNRLPAFIFLLERSQELESDSLGLQHSHELPLLIRIIWFFVLGWELGIFALLVGYVFCLTLIGIPVGIFVLNRVPLLLTLSQRYRP